MICEGWEGLTVDGKFPLLEWLGGWADRCVFLTVRQSTHTANIKLIQASGAEADACVAKWEAAKALPHPCLVEMMETGRYRLNDIDVAYVVTEKAETFLSGIVPRKALDPVKVQEILLPVVDALTFVHEKGFVHGSVKPSSIALIDEEWKLSADEMERAGEPLRLNRELDTYDAPELGSGAVTPAADMWSLGMIIVEACSQRTPVWDRNAPGDLGVPDWLPQPFQEIARECIRWDPARRISIGKVRDLLSRTAIPAASANAAPSREAEAHRAVSATAVATAPVSTLSERVAAVRAAEPDELRPAPKRLIEDEPGELTPRTPRLFGDLDYEEERPSRTGPVLFTLLVLLVIAAIFGIRYKDRIMPLIAKRSTPAQSERTPQTEAPQNPEGVAKSDQEPPPGAAQSSQSANQASGTATPAQSPAPQAAADAAKAPAQPAPQAQAPAETAEAKPQPEPEPKETPKTEERKAPPVPRVTNAKGAVLKRVLPNVAPGAVESMRRPVQVDVRVSVNSSGSVSSAQCVTQSRGNYWARISQQAAEGWKFKAPVSDGKARDSYWMLLFQYNRGRTDVVATELR
ncbi:protein kinase domain-containing protein [Occallatibacter savannae]|uniref:protein kinase domain-containing protein n=1 Tax=Occallatibacter savannae TaxID=1002691 RepID=UPI000D68AC90|nr:protein kinase family protein [Occallatibacter savannae]